MQFLTRLVAMAALSVVLGVGLNTARRRSDGGLDGGLDWINRSARVVAQQDPDSKEAQAFLIEIDKVEEFYEQDVFFLDARDAEHYVEGHIPGAHNFPAGEIIDRADELLTLAPTVAPVVIYCTGGNCEDSFEAYEQLKEALGYEQVYIYKNGWEEWSEPGKGRPYATGPTPLDEFVMPPEEQ